MGNTWLSVFSTLCGVDPEATFEIPIGNRPHPGAEQTLWKLGGAQS